MRLFGVFSLSLLFQLLFRGTSEAGVMIDNLGQSAVGFSAVNGPLGAAETWTAIQFTTGMGTWQFNSLTALFREDSSLTPDMLQIEVRNEETGKPGTSLLGTLTSTTDIGVLSNYQFSPTASFSLSGLTNYWLVAKPSNTFSGYGWAITTSDADNGQSGWSLADNSIGTANSGATWNSSPFPVVPILSIDASLTSAAVPEPSSVVIVGLSLLGFSIRRRVLCPEK